jgi:[ribosomal protein S5]-alanine N-acetyltransferase
MPGERGCVKLVSLTTPMLQALTRGKAAFTSVSGLEPVHDWPHPDFADALEFFLTMREVQPAAAEWVFLIVDAGSGRVVGDIGGKSAPVEGTLEVGYGIAASERQRGFASSALAAFLLECERRGVNTVTAECLVDNVGSIRVLEGAGFHATGTREDEAQQLRCWAKTITSR